MEKQQLDLPDELVLEALVLLVKPKGAPLSIIDLSVLPNDVIETLIELISLPMMLKINEERSSQ